MTDLDSPSAPELEDENAFGLLIAYHDLEDAEYSLERAEFVERFEAFRAAVLSYAAGAALGETTLVLDLGHALYFEIGDGDQATDPFGWLRGLRQQLTEKEFQVVAVLTHGGRWVPQTGADTPCTELLAGGYQLFRASRPSEPLRRALYAEAASHGEEEGQGWGAGLYVDTEAIEAMGRTLKNAPTPLVSGTATFYRLGR